MQTILGVAQVIIAIAMVALILLQRGPGATAGSGFGAGASATVFGARGSASFLTRSTSVLAGLFFVISFVMAMLASDNVVREEETDVGIMEGFGEQPPAEVVPGDDAEVPAMLEETPELPVDQSEVPMLDESATDEPPGDE